MAKISVLKLLKTPPRPAASFPPHPPPSGKDQSPLRPPDRSETLRSSPQRRQGWDAVVVFALKMRWKGRSTHKHTILPSQAFIPRGGWGSPVLARGVGRRRQAGRAGGDGGGAHGSADRLQPRHRPGAGEAAAGLAATPGLDLRHLPGPRGAAGTGQCGPGGAAATRSAAVTGLKSPQCWRGALVSAPCPAPCESHLKRSRL